MGWVQGPKKVDQDSAAAPQFYMPINGEEICFKESPSYIYYKSNAKTVEQDYTTNVTETLLLYF